jgi:SET domain
MYEIVNEPGSTKGRFGIATRFIEKGTVVLKEKPLLVAEDVYDALYRIYGVDDDECIDIDDVRAFRTAFETLVPHTIDKYVPSHNELLEDIETLPNYIQEFFSQLTWTPQRLRLLVSKFHRNAFTYSSQQCAILIDGAMFNHSCNNNLDFNEDSRGNFVFKTNRNIMKGEELCITYIETNVSRNKRMHTLQYNYGFQCSCSKCKS